MPHIAVNMNVVIKQLRALNPHKSTGPDGISPRVPRELAGMLARPWTNLFQFSLDKGLAPLDVENSYSNTYL